MAIIKYSENVKPDESLNKVETYDFSSDEMFGYEQDEEMKIALASEFADAAVARNTINNLTSTDTDKALSANQGKVLKDAQDAVVDSVSTLSGTVDTNRLYSDSQYLDLKAKYEAQQIALNASKAELYTDAPILQYGAVEIIGDGYEANDTPIDVSANVVDGSLELEQKGLTVTNLVRNGDFATGDTTAWAVVGGVTNVSVNDGVLTFTATTGNGAYSQILPHASHPSAKMFFACWVKADSSDVRLVVNHDANITSTAHSGNGNWELLKVVITTSASPTTLTDAVRDYRTSGWTPIQMTKANAINLTALGLSTITDTAILAKLLPYVDGTKSVCKMGIQILDADDNVTQTIFLPSIGNSLPNGVADSIKTVSDGWEHTKRVQEYVLQASDVPTLLTSNVNNDVVYIKKPLDFIGYGNTTPYLGSVSIPNFSMFSASSDGAGNVWNIMLNQAPQIMYCTVPKGTYVNIAAAQAALGGTVIHYQLATPITTHYDLPHLTSGKTIHRFVGEEKIALYGTGLTFSENVLSVLSAIKFVAGVMTDITSLATITTNTVTFSGVNATDVVYVKVEHDVDRPLGILEHTPAVSNTASRLASLEARVTSLET